MNIEEIFSRYKESVSQLYLYQRAVKANTYKELEQLAEYARQLDQHTDLKSLPSSFDKMSFHAAKDGERIVFARKSTNLEERKSQVSEHKKKQYQWLLSEAYELFEDFIEEAYACAGYADNDFWPLSDFGYISISELKSKNFDWFVTQAKAKRDRPQSILNRIREKLPEFAALEKTNSLGIDLKLVVILIEHLRHLIVHNGGITSDTKEFINKVLKKAGYSVEGNDSKDRIEYIDSFFANWKNRSTVFLHEVSVLPDIPLGIHVDVFDDLCSSLVSSAHALSESLMQHFGKATKQI
jgi:hypothetical protein